MKCFLSNLKDLVYDAIGFGLNGKQIDTLVTSLGINFLDPANPVPALVVQLSGAPAFEVLANGGMTGVVMINDITLFVSIFPPERNSFPVARVYHLPVPDFFEFAHIGRILDNRGISVQPLLPKKYEALLEADGYQLRITNYYAAYKKRPKVFSGLAAGRLSSTFVENSIIFDSKGCMLCGRDAGLLLTTTIGDHVGDPECQSIMLGFYVCPEHGAEADDDHSYFHFSKRRFGQPAPMGVIGRPPLEFLIECAVDFLRTQLDSRILKIKGGVITAERPSRFRIIVRLSEDKGYAYMFFNTAGEEVARIDGTAHHSVAFGPDHLHRAPRENNKDVVSSFTYGFPAADAKIIRRVLEEHGG